MNEEDRLLKQFLCVALLCGDVIPNENSDSDLDPVQLFLEEEIGQYAVFARAVNQGYIEQINGGSSDYVVTDKGKEFLR